MSTRKTYSHTRLKLVLLIGFSITCMGLSLARAEMPSVDEYHVETIHGFKVFFSPNVLGDDKLLQQTRKQLNSDLQKIIQRVPEPSLGYLRETAIWMEQGMPLAALNHLFFNGSKRLTRQHGMVPESYGGVIAGSSREYLAMAAMQPWQLLHELTHALHQFDLKHSFAPVLSAYNNALEKGLYERRNNSNMPIKVYALKNHKEYLSELTVVYFARHRKYPHDRVDLAKVDPLGYCAVVQAWGLLGQQPGQPPLLC